MAATDWLTIEEAKNTLQRGVAVDQPDELLKLQTILTAASMALDHKVGAAVKRTVTAERPNVRSARLSLKTWPVVSITSLTSFGTAVASTDYYSDDFGVLWREWGYVENNWMGNGWMSANGVQFPTTGQFGRGQLLVTYVAGRFDTTDDVTADFKLAAMITLKHLWDQDNSSGGPQFGDGVGPTPRTFAIPKRALAVVSQYVRPPAVG